MIWKSKNIASKSNVYLIFMCRFWWRLRHRVYLHWRQTLWRSKMDFHENIDSCIEFSIRHNQTSGIRIEQIGFEDSERFHRIDVRCGTAGRAGIMIKAVSQPEEMELGKIVLALVRNSPIYSFKIVLEDCQFVRNFQSFDKTVFRIEKYLIFQRNVIDCDCSTCALEIVLVVARENMTFALNVSLAERGPCNCDMRSKIEWISALL